MGSHCEIAELQHREGQTPARIRTALSFARSGARVAVLTALPLLTQPLLLRAQTDWPTYGHDPGGQRYSRLKQINTKNVSQLKLAWSFDLQAPAATSTRPRRSSTTPLVVDGVMYLSTPYNRALALEPETGKKLWEYEGKHPPGMRGIAYWPGDKENNPRIVFGTNDGWLIFLDAKTGKSVLEINLRKGIADKFPASNYGLSSPPAIYKNLVITGSHLQESPSLGPPGHVRAWDARTGELVWTFNTMQPEAWPGETGRDRSGLNVWGFMTVDQARGMIFLPIGTPTTDFYGADRQGSNLYGSSLVALDAGTGKLKWYYQTTHHDNWDYDLTAPPLLFEWKGRPAVAQFTKQGLLFMLNRLTGKPLFGVEERAVVADNPFPGGGDEPSPTQPFPLKPPALARNSFRPEEIATVTPEHEKYCRGLLAEEGGAMTGGPYAQYGAKLRVIFPSWIGGGNWGGMSYDPKLGYLFVNTQSVANLNKIIRSQDGTRFLRVGPDDKSLSLGEGNLFWDGEKNWPCQQPPWGEMIAVRAKTGDVAWRVPLGSFEELDAKGVPKTGTPNMGGSIVTAGGLVFIAATIDAKFHALDARTGKELWAAKMGADAQSTPMTYRGKDGKQYVAVVASGSVHYVRPNIPGTLYVYALDGAGEIPAITASVRAR